MEEFGSTLGQRHGNDPFGAIWIAKNSDGKNPAWDDLSERMKKIDLTFEEISQSSAIEKCGDTLITDKDESYYFEPDAFQLDPSILRSVLYDAIDENNVELYEKTEVDTIITEGNRIIPALLTTVSSMQKILLMQLWSMECSVVLKNRFKNTCHH